MPEKKPPNTVYQMLVQFLRGVDPDLLKLKDLALEADVLTALIKAAEARKERLLSLAQRRMQAADTDSLTRDGYGFVERGRTVSRLPDVLRRIGESHPDMPLEQYADLHEEWVLSPPKVEALVERGVIADYFLQDMQKRTTWAAPVTPPEIKFSIGEAQVLSTLAQLVEEADSAEASNQ